MDQEVECLSSNLKALSLNSSTTKKEKERKEEGGREEKRVRKREKERERNFIRIKIAEGFIPECTYRL
jgi:hypothetical protein